ncbi:MAG: O-antigen ligase family protein [Gammaproteobacteria bacterium]|nr:O-antigen ligase family protein [Gammaproteobacteria bacterium]
MKKLNAWIERYFPCSFERGGSLLVIVGVFSTLLYVYTKIAFRDELRDLPQNLMVLTFFISAWGQRQKLKSDLIFKLLILAFLIPWLLFGVNALIDYETANKYRSTNDLLKLFLFLPLAWWIGGSRAGAIRMLTIAFLGLITAVALDPNLMRSLSILWAGVRVDFAIHNAQHGALFFGLVIIFCICSLSQRVQNEPAVNWGNALLFLAGLIGLIGLVGTQTRAAFLGLLVTGFAALVQAVRQGNFFGQNHISKAKVVLVLILVTGLLAWPAKESLQSRIAAESASMHALLTGNLEELPFSSVGVRVHSWLESLKWIADRPVTGWGLKARTDVIRLAEHFPDDVRSEFGHLHNGYFELLLGYGVVGFAFICVLWGILLRRIKLSASNDLYALALYSSIFLLVLNIFESFFFYWSGEFAISLFMAGGYCQYLTKSLDKGTLKQDSARI